MARREIGVLASSKMTGRTHRIIAPAEQEKAMRYARRTTDYSILDNIGIIMLKTIIPKQFSLCMSKVILSSKGSSMTKWSACRTHNPVVPGVVTGVAVLSPSLVHLDLYSFLGMGFPV